MYVMQRNYTDMGRLKAAGAPAEEKRTIVVIVSRSGAERKAEKFKSIIEKNVALVNAKAPEETPWEVRFLDNMDAQRTPADNYMAIYTASLVIAECTEKKKNVFYMLGLAHAIGRPVCACYEKRSGEKADIPFNVHGRQSMSYSTATTEYQEDFGQRIKEWVIKYERNHLHHAPGV